MTDRSEPERRRRKTVSFTDSFVECVGEDGCGGDVVVAECLRAGGSVVGAESEQRVAKVCTEGAFDLSGDPVGALEVEPGGFFGDGSGTAVCDETDEVVKLEHNLPMSLIGQWLDQAGL